MCECFKKTIELVKKQLEGKNEVEVEWEHRTFFFDGKEHAPTVLKVNTEYRGIRTNGEACKNKTKNSLSIILTFCPMCGKRIEPIGEEK